jgi:hypothetical protein
VLPSATFQIKAELRDVNQDVMTTDASTYTLTCSSGVGALVGTPTCTGVAGVITCTGIQFTAPAGSNTLLLAQVESPQITISFSVVQCMHFYVFWATRFIHRALAPFPLACRPFSVGPIPFHPCILLRY